MEGRVSTSLATVWNAIFLFGGQSASGNFLNDLWVLPMDTLVWQQLGDEKSLISGRFGQVMES